jgi:HEAT repeat protein
MGMPGDESFDEAQIEREQIAEALSHLNSQKEEERIEAVEQLGAYPSPDTEATLSQLLTTDSNPEVRNAAALSLGSLDVPSDATLASLLTALDDQSEDVRFSALSTLEDFMLGQDEDSQTYKRIRSGLSAKVDSQSLSEDLKDSIKEVLKDPATANVPEAEPDN